MKPPRGLTAEEAVAWAHVAATVKPIAPNRLVAKPVEPAKDQRKAIPVAKKISPKAPAARAASPVRSKPLPPPPSPPGLDASWDRKLGRGSLQPDLTLDLHGHTLDTAYSRLLDGLDQARAMGARTVLLVTGKARPVEAADRGERRGAIRAKVLDWLAASRHHAAIAAVRQAHIRHGGEGALYIVLKRAR